MLPSGALPLVDEFRSALESATGMTSTPHLYVGGKESRALNPHTDPYDVLSLQLGGSKDWRVCIPSPKAAMPADSEAARAQLYEIEKENAEGCTSHDHHDLTDMACSSFTMHAGDVL